MTLKSARAKAPNIVEYEGDQLEIDFSEIDFDPDRPQLSLCPKCASDIIRLVDGCRICGWSEKQSKNDEPSVESSISIPCIVKQLNQPEFKGVIKRVEGDRFIVYIPDSDSTVTVPKLFVYPDFSKLDKSSSKQSPPSKIPPSKNRRKKGEGTGYIYRRTITRSGNQYQESYYRYRDESGKLRSKYIPQRLLDRVQDAESHKVSVTEVLRLLGVFEISRGEQSNESEFISRREPANNPSTKRRKYGYGGGYIECKPITKNGKQYKQYWFHWQVWRDGETVTKKSRYIPKRLVPKVERMNREKVSVSRILEVLGVKE